MFCTNGDSFVKIYEIPQNQDKVSKKIPDIKKRQNVCLVLGFK